MPRQQKTAPADTTVTEDLPELTQGQHKYLLGILEGKSLTDAYKAAYDTSNWTIEAVYVEASRLRWHPKIVLWLDAVRKSGADQAQVTLESHLGELARIKELALGTGNLGAAAQAEIARGKASGLYTERYEDLSRGKMSDNELLSRLAKIDPALASALGPALGIKPSDEEENLSDTRH